MKKLIITFAALLMANGLLAQTYTVDFNQSTSNISESNIQSANGDVNLGQEDVLRFSRLGGDYERSLLKFDMDIPPGVDIISAQLILYGVNHTYVTPGEGVLQMVPAEWNESTVNWNIATTLEDPALPFAIITPPSSSSDSYTLDVLSMVQKMVNSPLINFGWLLKMQDENGGTGESFSFGSSTNPEEQLQPHLIITYCNHLRVNAFVSMATSTTEANAGVFLDITGGVPPFTYLWSNSSTSKDIYNVTPGVYTVTVSDARSYNISKIIPVSGSCGTLTFSIRSDPANAGNAKLVNESFNENTANTNEFTSDIWARNIPDDDDGNSITRSLFSFDLNSLPDNIEVTYAKLRLTDNESPQANTFTVQLYKIEDEWNERTVDFNSAPGFDESPGVATEFEYDATQTYYDVDVTNDLQKMVDEKSSQKGWLLKLKDEDVTESGNSAKFQNPLLELILVMPSFACNDNALNWNQTDDYDENGAVISSEKTYLDNMGRLTQKLVKNAAGEVFRTQTVYDSYGVAALSSMPAYSGTQLKYQTNFMLNLAGQAFSYNDFDAPATLNNNSVLQNGITNSLGNYYSDANPYDAFQATATNPYTRTEMTGGGSCTRTSKAGTPFKMGSGRETLTLDMMSGDELKYIFGTTGGSYYSYKVEQNGSDVLECDPITVSVPILATKQVIITPDNPDLINYSIGDKVIASCYSGLSAGETYTNMTSVTNTMIADGTRCTDIHLPYANRASLKLPLPVAILSHTTASPGLINIDYKITDLYTDVVLTAGTDYTLGTSRTVTFSTAFLNLYSNRSLFLRLSFDYSSTYQSLLAIYSLGPPDVLVTYQLSYGRASKNYYDLGNLIRKSVSPKGFNIGTPNTNIMVTTYDYDHHGQLIGTKSPDQGIIAMTYNDEGQLRFSQNAVQKAKDYFSYINYDKHGRPYESGENHTGGANMSSVSFIDYHGQGNFIYPGKFSTIILDDKDGLLASEKTNTTITSYNVPASGDDVPSGYTYHAPCHKFRNGPVNFIKNNNSIIWYNYDKFGRSLATITQITEADFVAKTSALDERIKTSESTNDYYTGLMTTATYQTNESGESLYSQFSYDVNYRPTQTRLTYGGDTYTLNSSSYNKMGQLNRNVIGKNFQGVDFVYLLNGGLKSINHPGLDPSLDPGGDNGNYSGSSTSVNKDLFGESIDFFYKDYERAGSNIISSVPAGLSKYNGLIYASRFKTQNVVNTTTTGANYIDYLGSPVQLINGTNYERQELRFEYRYDQFSQLAGSLFETFNNVTNAATAQYSDYEESGASGGDIGYDRNGNITRLVRQAYGSVTLDNLTYTVGATNNQVTGILDAASNSFAQSVNFKTPSTSAPSAFNYNAIGQLTASAAENISDISYFPSGKIKMITFSNGNTTEFEYGAMGEKLKSKCYYPSGPKSKYTWYIGPYVYEFDELGANSFAIKEAKVPGGVIRVTSGASISAGYLVYHLTDHLGNVRVSFTKKTSSNTNGTGIEILSYNDYYAFGGTLPGRSYSAENFRYAYQGQEKAEDGTIWDQFELRSYNHDLGRWFSPDPYGEFSSPYIAMGNNPVSVTDPDGGLTTMFTSKAANSGYAQDKWDRDHQQGAYSTENTQKRYDMYMQNVRDHCLLEKYLDEPRNVAKFLDQVKDLNNWFGGLPNQAPLTFDLGQDYLSVGEINRNLDAMKELVRVFARPSPPRPEITGPNPVEEYVRGKAESPREGGVSWTAVNKIMDQNGEDTGHRAVISHNADGSEVIVEYNLNGELREDGSPAIDHISVNSASYSDARNNRAAGSSFDTRTYGNVGGGFVGPELKTNNTVTGLTILSYNSVQPGDYHELYGGVELDLTYKGAGAEGKWVQIINTNRPAPGKTSPYFDSNDGTIYYPAQEYDSATNTKSFYDRPGRLPENGNISWSAQLLLYNNKNKRVFSISYGFDLNNGVSTPKPLIIKKW